MYVVVQLLLVVPSNSQRGAVNSVWIWESPDTYLAKHTFHNPACFTNGSAEPVATIQWSVTRAVRATALECWFMWVV